jgi:hypothetical protein
MEVSGQLHAPAALPVGNPYSCFQNDGLPKNCSSSGFIISNSLQNLQMMNLYWWPEHPLKSSFKVLKWRSKQLSRKEEILTKGKQKEIKPNPKPKKISGTGKRKINFEESESDLPTATKMNLMMMMMTFQIMECISVMETCAWSEDNLEEMLSYGTDVTMLTVDTLGVQLLGFS